MTLDGYRVGIMEKNFTQHFGKWNTPRRFSSSMFMFGESITYSFDNHRQSIYEGRLFVCTYEIHQTGMLQVAFLVSLESSPGGGVYWLSFMAFGLAV
jgi:hypothetical protein